jgi:hypothetical protein
MEKDLVEPIGTRCQQQETGVHDFPAQQLGCA